MPCIDSEIDFEIDFEIDCIDISGSLHISSHPKGLNSNERLSVDLRLSDKKTCRKPMPPSLFLLAYLEAFLRFLAECGEIPVFREASKTVG